MTTPLISVIIPTIGRSGLAATLASIRNQVSSRDAEILVCGDTYAGTHAAALAEVPVLCGQWGARYIEYAGDGHMYGQPQRQFSMTKARGQWLAFSQDDQVWAPDAWAAIRAALRDGAACPRLFRAETRCGATVWQTETLAHGNCDADGIVVQNDPGSLGVWQSSYDGDWAFIRDTVARWAGWLHFESALISLRQPEAA